MSHCPCPYQQINLLVDKIYAIPDGVGGSRRPLRVRWAGARRPGLLGAVVG
jgi:hypothetical protein